LYPKYDFEVLPVVIGATGLITKHIEHVLKRMNVDNVGETIMRCQRSALSGTLKIVKSFMKM